MNSRVARYSLGTISTLRRFPWPGAGCLTYSCSLQKFNILCRLMTSHQNSEYVPIMGVVHVQEMSVGTQAMNIELWFTQYHQLYTTTLRLSLMKNHIAR